MSPLYHPGELAVQARAGQRAMADRVGKSIGFMIPPAAQAFLQTQPLVIVSTRDAGGHMWASPLTGPPGFMRSIDPQTVQIEARPLPGDPLADNLGLDRRVGMLVIDFATRRRMRLNGRAELQTDVGLMRVHAYQVYANCSKYIQSRTWEKRELPSGTAPTIMREPVLTVRQQRWISAADTFFIASGHPDGGLDASHRGGTPGFVRALNERLLVWPDYSGNMMFQTLGNIAADPHVGLLFIDFERGSTLQVTGRARILWDDKRMAEIAGAERLVEFHLDEARELTGAIPLRGRFIDFSPFNP